MKLKIFGALSVMVVACAAFVLQMNDARASYRTETVVAGLQVPWSMAWLPNGDMLVTERRGELLRIRDGAVIAKIKGVPAVKASGQGGLLDVVLHPDFAKTKWVYLSYSDPEGEGQGANTSIVRGQLEGDALKNLELIYQAGPNTGAGVHYGGRMVFNEDGYLFFSIGDRGNRDENPQSLELDGGKIYRVHEDGKIPADNPMRQQPNLAAIYSYGHRNPQGLAFRPGTGDIWSHEHGPKGGDEVNLIKAGANYGWPILSYGVNYSGTPFAEGTERVGYESPAWYWVPSIAPSGMAFVSSDTYPDWQGHLLVGSLKFGQLVLCELDGNEVVDAEPVLTNLGRVRDVRQAPDGYVYLAIEGIGIQRIVRAE